MKDFLYKATVEAKRKPNPYGLRFAWTKIALPSHHDDWIGSVYVISDNSKDAEIKIIDYMKENATEWSFICKMTKVKCIESDLDRRCIDIRDDLWKLENGEVVPGWGI